MNKVRERVLTKWEETSARYCVIVCGEWLKGSGCKGLEVVLRCGLVWVVVGRWWKREGNVRNSSYNFRAKTCSNNVIETFAVSNLGWPSSTFT